jgi:hypothetical protein
MVFDLLCYVLCGIAGIKTSEKVLPIWPVGPLRVPDWTMAAGAYIL